MAVNWTCPHCDRDQVVVEKNMSSGHYHIYLGNLAEGSCGFQYSAVECANYACRKLTFFLTVGNDHWVTRSGDSSEWQMTTGRENLFFSRLLPAGAAKPQPDYIPAPLREDYIEACKIRDLSPKAAATLARRCIQGIIRDFAGISGQTLFEEIAALRKAVDEGSADRAVTIESVNAIDQVRGIGNIGAHMEKDINLIIPVDAGEAQLLIQLIELLFSEWYVARHQRQERFSAIAALSAEKDAARKGGAGESSATSEA